MKCKFVSQQIPPQSVNKNRQDEISTRCLLLTQTFNFEFSGFSFCANSKMHNFGTGIIFGHALLALIKIFEQMNNKRKRLSWFISSFCSSPTETRPFQWHFNSYIFSCQKNCLSNLQCTRLSAFNYFVRKASNLSSGLKCEKKKMK